MKTYLEPLPIVETSLGGCLKELYKPLLQVNSLLHSKTTIEIMANNILKEREEKIKENVTPECEA